MKLPPELCIEIVEHHHWYLYRDREMLKTLSLVNPLFRDAAQRIIFEQIELSKGLDKVKEKVEGMTADNGRLASFVKRLIIRGSAVMTANEFNRLRGSLFDKDGFYSDDKEEEEEDEEDECFEEEDDVTGGDKLEGDEDANEAFDDSEDGSDHDHVDPFEQQAAEFRGYLLKLLTTLKDKGNQLMMKIDVQDESHEPYSFDEMGLLMTAQHATNCVESVALCLGMVDMNGLLVELYLNYVDKSDTEWFYDTRWQLSVDAENSASDYDPAVLEKNLHALVKVGVVYRFCEREGYPEDEKSTGYCRRVCRRVLANSRITKLNLSIYTLWRPSSLTALKGNATISFLELDNIYLSQDFGLTLQTMKSLRELSMNLVRINWYPRCLYDKAIPWETILTSLSKLRLAKLYINQLHSDFNDVGNCHAREKRPGIITEREEDVVALKVLVDTIINGGGKVHAGSHKLPLKKFEDIYICLHRRRDEEDWRGSCPLGSGNTQIL